MFSARTAGVGGDMRYVKKTFLKNPCKMGCELDGYMYFLTAKPAPPYCFEKKSRIPLEGPFFP